MSKTNGNSKNKLGLNLFEANLKRHPSVKCLFDENGKRKSSSKSKDEHLLLNIDNKSEKESHHSYNYNGELEENYEIEKIKEKKYEKERKKRNIVSEDKKDKKEKRTMSVQINRVEEKIVDNKETFFVEMNEEERKELMKRKMESHKKLKKYDTMPLNYGFNDLQKELDKNITEAISKGKEYSEIEGKFINHLKKKE